MDPLIKLVALSCLFAAVFTAFYYRFVRPRVHYMFDGLFPAQQFLLSYLARWLAVRWGFLPVVEPGFPWVPNLEESRAMLIANLVTSLMVILIGSLSGGFKESPSWIRARERAHEHGLAAKKAQEIRAAGSR